MNTLNNGYKSSAQIEREKKVDSYWLYGPWIIGGIVGIIIWWLI